jgi:hypothetical protein
MADANLDIVVRVRGGQVASQEIKQVGESVGGVGTASEQTSKKTSGLGRTLKGLASGIAVYKGYSFVKGAIDTTTQLAKATVGLQRITGFDTKESAGWVEMAKARGIQSRQLNQGFITLNKNIAGGVQGSKSARGAFQQLGLDPLALKVTDAQTRMGMLSESFRALPNGVDKAALAQKLFGRGAQNMLPILSQTAKGLKGQVDAYGEESGMSGKNVQDTLKLVQAQRQWESAMTGVKVAVGTALIPLLTSLAQVITPIAQAFSKAMQSSMAFRVAIIALGVTVLTFAVIMAASFGAISAPVALVIAGIVGIAAALVFLYQKVGWFRAGVDAMGKAAVAAFNWIKQAAIGVFNWVKGNWPLLVSILGGPLAAAAVQMVKHWDTIKAGAQSVWNFLRGLGAFIGGAFAGAWNVAKGAVQGVASAIEGVVSAAQKVSSLPGKGLKLVEKMIPGGQGGGTITRAGSILVGESGPEIVHLPASAQITPNFALPSFGGGNVHVTSPVYLDRRQIALAMGDYTADQQAAR